MRKRPAPLVLTRGRIRKTEARSPAESGLPSRGRDRRRRVVTESIGSLRNKTKEAGCESVPPPLFRGIFRPVLKQWVLKIFLYRSDVL